MKTQSHDAGDTDRTYSAQDVTEVDANKVTYEEQLPGESGAFHFPWRSMFWALAIVVGIGLIVWSFGQGGQQLFNRWITEPLMTSPPSIDLLDVRNNRILMIEKHGQQNRVLVQEAGQASWYLISTDDYSAADPVISSDGSYVAYRSQLGSGRVEIVPVEPGSRTLIDAVKLQSVLPEHLVCPWSPIAWSPDSQAIAFFACNDQGSRSMGVWTAINTINIQQITGTETQNTQPRQLQWLSDTQVSVSSPVPNGDGTIVTTHDAR